jgi:rod shape-determining protein MreC
MNKWSFAFFAIAISLIYYFFGAFVQSTLKPISDVVTKVYNNISSNAESNFDDYLNQAKTNKELRVENKELLAQTLKYKEILKELSEDIKLVKFNPYENNSSLKISTTKVVGYSNLPNLTRLWLDFVPTTPKPQSGLRIFGLIYPLNNKIDSVACGIAVEKNNGKFEAILNGDDKCSYAVMVGPKKAPGIVYGSSQSNLIVKYIPTWIEIKEGDEVVTGGLDNIFFEGIKVGRVKKVNTDNTYNEAVVEAYYNPLNPTRFYVIEKAK